MSKRAVPPLLAVLAFWGSAAVAVPGGTSATRQPSRLPPQFTDRFNRSVRPGTFNRLSPATRALVRSGQHGSSGRLPTFPTFNGSFTFGDTTFPYTMVGNDPRRGGRVQVDTSLIMLSFLFDELVKTPDGGVTFERILIDSSGIVDDVVNSPNFVPFDYTDGRAQFSDAVQRASFFNVMKKDWHTSIGRPRMLTPVTIEVPLGLGEVFEVSPGKFVGTVDSFFLDSQIGTILQLEGIRTDELPILVSSNVSASDLLGYHVAVDVTVGHRQGIQTYVYTSWFDLDVGGPIDADASTLTHEISEWMADPFVNNPVPEYIIPRPGSLGDCQNLLEIGDPIEFLPGREMDITVSGRLYHTQVETMLQWFTREVPSTGFAGAYSYPDTTVFTAPSDPCLP